MAKKLTPLWLLLTICLMVFLLAIGIVILLTLPKVADVSGILGWDSAEDRWTLMAVKGEVLHYYQIQNSDPLARWVDCRKCLYSADLRVRIFSKKSGKVHSSDVVGYLVDVDRVWNIKRSLVKPECTHKK